MSTRNPAPACHKTDDTTERGPCPECGGNCWRFCRSDPRDADQHPDHWQCACEDCEFTEDDEYTPPDRSGIE